MSKNLKTDNGQEKRDTYSGGDNSGKPSGPGGQVKIKTPKEVKEPPDKESS